MRPLPYRFRPLSVSDLPLVRQWLSHPHVAEWWGDPVPALSAIEHHLTDPAMDVFIVSFEDAPSAISRATIPMPSRIILCTTSRSGRSASTSLSAYRR